SGALMLLDEKIRAAEGALAIAAGGVVEATAGRETAVPGETRQITVGVWNAGSQPAEVRKIDLESPAGWQAAGTEAAGKRLEPGQIQEWKLSAGPPSEAAPTLPY